jgi:hypothetical protein
MITKIKVANKLIIKLLFLSKPFLLEIIVTQKYNGIPILIHNIIFIYGNILVMSFPFSIKYIPKITAIKDEIIVNGNLLKESLAFCIK